MDRDGSRTTYFNIHTSRTISPAVIAIWAAGIMPPPAQQNIQLPMFRSLALSRGVSEPDVVRARGDGSTQRSQDRLQPGFGDQ